MIRAFLVASQTAPSALQTRLRPLGVKIVGATESIDDVGIQLSDAGADVLLIDSAAEQAQAILDSLADSELSQDVPVILLVDEPSTKLAQEALRAGIRGLLSREAPAAQLAAALQAAVSGLTVFLPDTLPPPVPTGSRNSTEFAESAEPLTPREREVLQMLASGLGNKEIAARLNISDHTAKFHVAAILAKLGAATRTEAVTIGIRRGFVLL